MLFDAAHYNACFRSVQKIKAKIHELENVKNFIAFMIILIIKIFRYSDFFVNFVDVVMSFNSLFFIVVVKKTILFLFHRRVFFHFVYVCFRSNLNVFIFNVFHIFSRIIYIQSLILSCDCEKLLKILTIVLSFVCFFLKISFNSFFLRLEILSILLVSTNNLKLFITEIASTKKLKLLIK